MKKILVLTLSLIAVVTLLGIGTWAYFNDVATVEDNTVTAGTLYIDDVAMTAISVGPLTPTNDPDAFAEESMTIANAGNLSGILSQIKISNATSNGNGLVPPEEEVGDVADGAGEGELDDYLRGIIWVDANNDGDYDPAPGPDFYIEADGDIDTDALPAAFTTDVGGEVDTINWDFVSSYGTSNALNLALAAANPGDTDTVGVHFCFIFPASDDLYGGTELYADNIAQGDDLTFDATFYLNQD